MYYSSTLFAIVGFSDPIAVGTVVAGVVSNPFLIFSGAFHTLLCDIFVLSSEADFRQ